MRFVTTIAPSIMATNCTITRRRSRISDKAIELYPDYIVAIANRGVTYENLGKKEEAIADS